MVSLEKNYMKLSDDFLFKKIADERSKFEEKFDDVIDLSIGDIKLPLSKSVIDKCKKASDEMLNVETFRGYSPNGGYLFLKEKIQNEYSERKISVELDEIFISDGAKSDISNILDLFSSNNTSLIPDPVYPVYVDTNIMKGTKIIYSDCNEENNFLPSPNFNIKVDLIYICSPNNPTGSSYTKEQLSEWVEYANYNKSIILYDAAYEAFISDKKYCKSIFEIEGSKTCAIEFKSFSKSSGFTGMRCGYTIVPNSLVFDGMNLNKMWNRRHSTKFNGVPYIIQRAAEETYSEKGKEQCKKSLMYYKENAKILSDALRSISIDFVGGDNSPYIWMKCPFGMKSWDFFRYLLSNFRIVGVPGVGFGKNGEHFFRLSCFGLRDNINIACNRLKKIKENYDS